MTLLLDVFLLPTFLLGGSYSFDSYPFLNQTFLFLEHLLLFFAKWMDWCVFWTTHWGMGFLWIFLFSWPNRDRVEWSVWILFICWKLKTYWWKYCIKIFFKRKNTIHDHCSRVFVLWLVHKQCHRSNKKKRQLQLQCKRSARQTHTKYEDYEQCQRTSQKKGNRNFNTDAVLGKRTLNMRIIVIQCKDYLIFKPHLHKQTKINWFFYLIYNEQSS